MVRQNKEHKGVTNIMTTDKERHVQIVAARVKRGIANGNTTHGVFWEDLDMLLDLILGGEA